MRNVNKRQTRANIEIMIDIVMINFGNTEINIRAVG